MKTLYLVQHIDFPEYTKIGFTHDIDKRIKQLDTASPTGIKLIYSVNHPRADLLERYFHQQMARKRSRLEWFKLTNEDIMHLILDIEEKVSMDLDRS